MSSVTQTLSSLYHQAAAKDATVNLSSAERILSAGAGAGLILNGLRGGPVRMLVSGLVGAALIRRGASGHCDVYQALGFSTAEKSSGHVLSSHEGVRVEKSVQVANSPAEVYRFWRHLENLPQFMSHLESVRENDSQHSHWVAKAILGSKVEWDAELINERENELIAWRSLPGSDIDTAGSVRFEAAPAGSGTVIHVNLQYKPVGGRLGIALASFLGADAETNIENDLDQLKEVLERGNSKSPQLTGGLGEAAHHHS